MSISLRLTVKGNIKNRRIVDNSNAEIQQNITEEPLSDVSK